MSEEQNKQAPQKDPKTLVVDAMLETVFSKTDMDDRTKAEACYTLVISAMMNFIPSSMTQARILKEAKALEAHLGQHMSMFDIVLHAKPRPVVKKEVKDAEVSGTEQSPVSTVEGSDNSESGSTTA